MKPFYLPFLVIVVAAVSTAQPEADGPGDVPRLLIQTLTSHTEQDPIGSHELAVVQLDFTGTREIVHLAGTNLEILFNPRRGPSVTAVGRYTVDGNPRGLVTGDFNGDSRRDIAILGFDSERIELLFGDGRGAFPERATIAAGPAPQSLAAGDFDRDGRVDLAYTFESDESHYSVTTLLQRANGEFAQGDPVSVGRTPFGMAVADFDGDGSLDIAVANTQSDSVSVLLNNGGGGFTEAATYSSAGEPWDIEAADLDADGALDLVTANAGTRTVSVLRGIGGGRFDQAIDYAAEQELSGRLAPTRLAVADLTGDGNIDAVLSNGCLLAGRGDGSFHAPMQYDFSAGTIALTDLDGDHRMDIVADHDFASSPHVMLAFNREMLLNRPPVGNVPDLTMAFGELAFFDGRESVDPDGHLVFFEWRDERNRFLGSSPTQAVRRLPGEYRYKVTLRDSLGAETVLHPTLTVTGDAPPLADIVLHAANATRIVGNWERIADPSAAGGARLHLPNAGASRVALPHARPASYFELTFKADPSLVYALWIRARSDGDSWKGDSAYVQFSGTVGLGFEDVWRIGTAEALTFSLEQCVNCGLDGWGWNTDGFASPGDVGTFIFFNDDEEQRIRIQPREDGISIDQIVLSSVTYIGGFAPGSARHDDTVLSRTQ